MRLEHRSSKPHAQLVGFAEQSPLHANLLSLQTAFKESPKATGWQTETVVTSRFETCWSGHSQRLGLRSTPTVAPAWQHIKSRDSTDSLVHVQYLSQCRKLRALLLHATACST